MDTIISLISTIIYIIAIVAMVLFAKLASRKGRNLLRRQMTSKMFFDVFLYLLAAAYILYILHKLTLTGGISLLSVAIVSFLAGIYMIPKGDQEK